MLYSAPAERVPLAETSLFANVSYNSPAKDRLWIFTGILDLRMTGSNREPSAEV
jgi:hypothetical protein